MKKYETVNEFRRNGIFTNNGFKTFGNMMVGRCALSNLDRDGREVTKFIDLVMFRDRTTGRFPFEDLFTGGRKVVFTGSFRTREYTDRNGQTRQSDEVVVTEMHENVARETEEEAAEGKRPPYVRERRRDAARPGGPFDPAKGEEAAPMDGYLDTHDLPEGFDEAEDVEF